MSRVYDNWERLVKATLNREKLRELALCESFSSSISSSRFSFISLDDYEASRVSDATIDPTTFGLRPMEFNEIRKATICFNSEWLVVGANCTFWKGWMNVDTLTAVKPGFGTVVAVRKWTSDRMYAHKEWSAEIKYLSQLHHPNLVKLIGYCSEENHRLYLVYEFMEKGSLYNNVIFRGLSQLFTWDVRIKVAVGVARALSFLHDREVIHCNFRCFAILLDGEFNAKLWDVSLAEKGSTGGSEKSIVGTFGYVAPEYYATGRLTARCDVYAFGVVLLELLAGRRVIDNNRVAGEQNLVEWAKPYMAHKRTFMRIMDNIIHDQYTVQGAYSVATLALQCLNHDPIRRPKMSEVVIKLENLKGV